MKSEFPRATLGQRTDFRAQNGPRTQIDTILGNLSQPKKAKFSINLGKSDYGGASEISTGPQKIYFRNIWKILNTIIICHVSVRGFPDATDGPEVSFEMAIFWGKFWPRGPKTRKWKKSSNFEVQNICFPPILSKNEERIPTGYFWPKNRFPGSEWP